MKTKVYVIRWHSFYEADCKSLSGTFEVAYTDEQEAAEALLKDYSKMLAEIKEVDPACSSNVEESDSGCADYAIISTTSTSGGVDTHEWFVDTVEVDM